MFQVLDFFSERARGFILTMTGTGTGLLPNAMHVSEEVMNNIMPLQKLVLVLSAIVAILTIISYGYKFYKFLTRNKKK